jgi:hypothetical protein
MFLVETFLQWMEFAVLFQALNGHNLATVRLDSKHSARFGSFTIDKNSASTTGCSITTNMCASQLQTITNPMD